MDAIRTEGLTKQYKDIVAVDNLCLSIKRGELFSLLGVNGAGKSTLILSSAELFSVRSTRSATPQEPSSGSMTPDLRNQFRFNSRLFSRRAFINYCSMGFRLKLARLQTISSSSFRLSAGRMRIAARVEFSALDIIVRVSLPPSSNVAG